MASRLPLLGFTREFFQGAAATAGGFAQGARLLGIPTTTFTRIVTGATQQPSARTIARAAAGFARLPGFEQRGVMLGIAAIQGRDPGHSTFLTLYSLGFRRIGQSGTYTAASTATRALGREWLSDRVSDLENMLRRTGQALEDFIERGGISGQVRQEIA